MVGKILIVDGVATNRIVFKVALGEAFYLPLLAGDGESCLRLAQSERPDLVLLDLALPDIAGIAVIEQIRANPLTRDIPILALSVGDDTAGRKGALLAGADDVLPKHGAIQILLARLRNLMRRREEREGLGAAGTDLNLIGLSESQTEFFSAATISILAGPATNARSMCQKMKAVLSDRIILQSREEALVETDMGLGRAAADVFILNAAGTGMADSLRLMSELRSRATTRHSAICILTDSGPDDALTMAFDQGADDLVDISTSPEELGLRLRALIRRKRRDDQLRACVQNGLRMAVIDPLTGLHNRRYAMPQLSAIADRMRAAGGIFAVMVIDLDRFKSVNDRFGHASGDAVLVEVARRLQSNVRDGDLVARIGGEEFLVALPDTSFDAARDAADRLRHAIEEQPIHLDLASVLKVTVSIGLAVSSKSPASESVNAIIDRADHALLRAKSEGRNKVTIGRSAA